MKFAFVLVGVGESGEGEEWAVERKAGGRNQTRERVVVI